MIEYGIACLFVCLLALPDRRVMLYALTILASWSAGYLAGMVFPEPWMAWPIISAVVGVALAYLHTQARFWWSAPVASIAGAMFLLDGAYVLCRWSGIQIEVEYANALNAGLIVKLAMIGLGGLSSDWIGFLGRCGLCLHRGPSVAHAREGSEGRG